MIVNKDLLELEKNSNKTKINNGLTEPSVSPFLITPQQAPKTKPNFFKMEESSVLNRVKDFLPKLKEANIDLKKKIENKEDVNIENIKEGDEYIQMNLALGILEHKEELSENNIKITSNNKNNNNNNNNNTNTPILEINKENENENNNNNDNKKRKQPNNANKTCTDNNNKNNNKNNNLDEQINFNPENSKNILDIINTPPSIIDKFGLILDNSDDDDNDDDLENQEKLEPLEINY